MRLRQLDQGQSAHPGRPGSQAAARRRGGGPDLGQMKKLLFAFLALSALSAEGQNYPQRPVRMIVPFAAGGTTDALGRVLAVFLSERLGQQVVVENRPGGGGTLGAEVAARPERDLVPVAMVARAPNILIVHPSVPVTTLAQLIQFSRSNPGKIRYGSPGIGSNPHLIGELFASRFKLDMIHVPYKGGGAGIADVQSGQIEMLITGIATASGRVKAGQVRALAVTGAMRTALMPEVPTLAELVGSDFVLGALFGVFVPVNTPHEAIGRLSRELPAISRDPDFSRRLVDIGQELTEPLLGEAFGRAIRDEAARWRELSTMAGVKED